MQTLTRIFEFDAAHRVMHERVKCYNLHGHRFKVELTFSYENKGALGYAIDFKEIKRIAGAWIDEHLDHASIFNPYDEQLIMLCKNHNWKLHIMGLGSFNDINPSAENIASEIFYVIQQLFLQVKGLSLQKVRLYETPNCWVDCVEADYVASDKYLQEIKSWRESKGEFNYDAREV